MHRRRQPILSLSLVTALFGAPVSAQSGGVLSEWLELFSPDLVAHRVVQSAVTALRSEIDITYGGLAVDTGEWRATLYDVTVWPMKWVEYRDCKITIDHMSMKLASTERRDEWRLGVSIGGVEMNKTCLPDGAQTELTLAGLKKLSVPRLELDLEYEVGPRLSGILCPGALITPLGSGPRT
ncbi:hypothetical protein [Salipiger bermudensis]|uniref:hypothetical protein n=1 Tax=Salipiger bermudensis TaxID=344736 RepID=UPI0011855D6F|nr:hypothetical protein [Salipiger bermudensis]